MGGGEADGVDFFISHAGPDAEWAAWVGAQLVDAGYTVELDAWDWSAGINFVMAMERALERARRMIAVLTPTYFSRTWTGVERHAVFAEHLQTADGYLVPVMAAPCEEMIPRLIRPLLRIELVGLSEAEARRRLLKGVADTRRPAQGERVPYPGERAIFPAGLPAVRDLPTRNLFFTGRNRLLVDLARRLREDSGAGRVAVSALQGVGGVGKSQLALEYAWRHANDYHVIWWVDAEDPSGVGRSLVDLAAELGLPVQAGANAVTPMVHAELARRGDWLLVYDNVEDLDFLGELPSGGHIIVTCRDSAVGGRMPTLPVGVFTRAEAVQLLRRRAPNLSAADADRVAAAAGDLPLAVAQAGSYLAATGTPTTDYLDRLASLTDTADLARRPKSMASAHVHAARAEATPALIATTTAALRELNESDPVALDLLHQLAFLAPEPIPLAAIAPGVDIGSTGGLAVGDPATTRELVHAVIRLDLARQSGTRLHIHRRVQDLVHSRLQPDRRLLVLSRVLRLLATAMPGDPDAPVNWPAYADLNPHLHAATIHLDTIRVAEPAGFRHLLLATCRYLYASGQYRQAHSLAEQSRQRWQHSLGADHPDTLNSAINLAGALHGLGRRQAARRLDEDTLARRRRVLGDDHPDTLRSANGLAADLHALGEYDVARTMDEDTLTRYRRVLGDDHPHTLHSAHNLAADLRALGEYDVARTMDEDTLTRYRRVLGDDHPHTLGSAHNLAEDLHALGDQAAARHLWEETLARRQRVLGSNHPETLKTAESLRQIRLPRHVESL